MVFILSCLLLKKGQDLLDWGPGFIAVQQILLAWVPTARSSATAWCSICKHLAEICSIGPGAWWKIKKLSLFNFPLDLNT